MSHDLAVGPPHGSYTVFQGPHRRMCGTPAEVVQALATSPWASATEPPLLVLNNLTGAVVDIDQRDVIAARTTALAQADGVSSTFSDASPPAPDEPSLPGPRGRGRPRLGVIPREVTLLPAHWEWLAAQPGGASVTLRRLVEHARRHGEADERRRRARDAAYQAMRALGGDLPGFEEASRALFADDRARLEGHLSAWPADVREYVLGLASVD